MMRLDHNRAVNQIASKLDSNVKRVSNICVWGNHSPTMVVDITNGLLDGSNNLKDLLEEQWIAETLRLSTVAKRGAKIIDQRGLSSAAKSGAQGPLLITCTIGLTEQLDHNGRSITG